MKIITSAEPADLGFRTPDGKPVIGRLALVGDCHAIVLQDRGRNDPHQCITIYTEDDECWFPTGNGFSSYWLPEFVALITEAQARLKQDFAPDPTGFGFVAK